MDSLVKKQLREPNHVVLEALVRRSLLFAAGRHRGPSSFVDELVMASWHSQNSDQPRNPQQILGVASLSDHQVRMKQCTTDHRRLLRRVKDSLNAEYLCRQTKWLADDRDCTLVCYLAFSISDVVTVFFSI